MHTNKVEFSWFGIVRTGVWQNHTRHLCYLPGSPQSALHVSLHSALLASSSTPTSVASITIYLG